MLDGAGNMANGLGELMKRKIRIGYNVLWMVLWTYGALYLSINYLIPGIKKRLK